MDRPKDITTRSRSLEIKHIMDAYGDLVMTLCRKILFDPLFAEEAAQDTFIKAYKNLDRFREASSLKTWIYRIAYHTAIDYSRKKKHRALPYDALPEQAALFADPSSQEVLENKEQEHWLYDGIREMPPDQAALITLYYLEDKNIREVSEITGLSESNVKIRLFRARKMLAEILVKSQKV